MVRVLRQSDYLNRKTHKSGTISFRKDFICYRKDLQRGVPFGGAVPITGRRAIIPFNRNSANSFRRLERYNNVESVQMNS